MPLNPTVFNRELLFLHHERTEVALVLITMRFFILVAQITTKFIDI